MDVIIEVVRPHIYYTGSISSLTDNMTDVDDIDCLFYNETLNH
jgi:hypothetical protein